MNFFQLVIKQMRQRALSSWLTLLSVLLGVGLAISLMVFQRESEKLFAQTDFGYEIIIGPPKGSPLQLTLNSVYHMDVSPGVIPFEIYENMSRKGAPTPGRPDYGLYVSTAVPLMVGDSFKGRRIVGTSPEMFGVDDEGKPVTRHAFEYRKGKSYEFSAGRAFAPRKFEAVIGSDVARALNLKLYDDKLSEEENEKAGGAFRATHGMPGPNEKPDIHKPRWHIVGILKPTATANDRVLFVPFISLYAIAEHEEGMIEQILLRNNINPDRIPPDQIDEVLRKLGVDPLRIPESIRKKFKMKSAGTRPAAKAPRDVGELLQDATLKPGEKKAEKEEEEEDPDAYHLDEKGNIVPDLPREGWLLSAILVKAKGGIAPHTLMYTFKVIDDRATAVNPATVMREFFDTFMKGSILLLLAVSVLVIVVAAISILVSIYNSVMARRREIAILRALGATRTKVLWLICIEAGLIGLLGGAAGLVFGHILAFAASVYMHTMMGQELGWYVLHWHEGVALVVVVILAVIAGLVPGLKAYRTSVAANLMAS